MAKTDSPRTQPTLSTEERKQRAEALRERLTALRASATAAPA